MKSMEKWTYIGVFLGGHTRAFLAQKFPLPKGWKRYGDHMTVVFNDGSLLSKQIKEVCDQINDKVITLRVRGIGMSDKAMALKVELPFGLLCANKIPHITLGVSPEGKPVDSNYIENWNTIWEEEYLTGALDTI